MSAHADPWRLVTPCCLVTSYRVRHPDGVRSMHATDRLESDGDTDVPHRYRCVSCGETFATLHDSKRDESDHDRTLGVL